MIPVGLKAGSMGLKILRTLYKGKKKIGDVSVIIKKFNRGGVVSRGTRPMVFATGIPTALRKGM